MNKKILAFTLVEIIVSLSIMAFVSMLGFISFAKMTPKAYKLKFKSANLSFKSSIQNMISNPLYYDEESGFMDLEEVIFDDNNSGVSEEIYGVEKFRKLLLRELGISFQNNLECYMLTNDLTPTKKNLCYIADNSVVWGIPNTDFYEKGIVIEKSITKRNSRYVPITIYTDVKKVSSEEDFQKYAILLGVRADGTIKLLNTVDCKDRKYKKYAQCDVADMFASLDTRYERN